jgi:hypothetical protein
MMNKWGQYIFFATPAGGGDHDRAAEKYILSPFNGAPR